jgi:hypothetical protein
MTPADERGLDYLYIGIGSKIETHEKGFLNRKETLLIKVAISLSVTFIIIVCIFCFRKKYKKKVEIEGDRL